jgi:hypothetical protein
MHCIAMIADWPQMQEMLAGTSAGGAPANPLDADISDGLLPATATQDSWKVVLDEEAGQVFDATKPNLPDEARATLQEFFVYCCWQQWQDDARQPPHDLVLPDDDLDIIRAAIEPTKVKHCFSRMQQLDFGEVQVIVQKALPRPGLRLIKTEAHFREFIDMWLDVFREAAAKGWGVLLMRS